MFDKCTQSMTARNVLSPHEFKGDTEMVPEVEVVNHVDDIVLVVLVLCVWIGEGVITHFWGQK